MGNSVAELLNRYMSVKRTMGLSQETINRVVLNVNMFCGDMNIQKIEQITTDAVLGWGDRKLRQGVERSTLYTYFNSLRSFLGFLSEIGINHRVDVSRVKCRPLYRKRVSLRPHEIQRIINHASPTAKILIRLLFTSGMRISEALSLTGAHVYEGTTVYISGKGGKVRPVFITPQLQQELQTLATISGGFCFVDALGEQLDRKKAYYLIKQAMIKAGFPQAYPHSLRHSFCTDLLRNGAGLAQTSRLMGHSSVAITQIYEHLLTDDIEKTHKLLSKV